MDFLLIYRGQNLTKTPTQARKLRFNAPLLCVPFGAIFFQPSEIKP